MALGSDSDDYGLGNVANDVFSSGQTAGVLTINDVMFYSVYLVKHLVGDVINFYDTEDLNCGFGGDLVSLVVEHVNFW